MVLKVLEPGRVPRTDDADGAGVEAQPLTV